jgi:S1-C subfamily serine protease
MARAFLFQGKDATMNRMKNDAHIVAIIKRVLPAVVSITVTQRLEDVEREARAEFFDLLPPKERAKAKKSSKRWKIPKELVDHSGMVETGSGSGFFVEAGGLVLTNKHVISDPKAHYTVVTDAGEKIPAEIVSRDPINDVAVLRLESASRNFPAIPLGDSSTLELGESVLAIGNALGVFRNTVSLGIISGLSRAITAQGDMRSLPHELRGLIQTDAAINPGNSGGPLVDLEGRAVGINTAVIYNAQNIGFAIPVNAAKRDLEDIMRYGRIRRPFLGVRYIIIDEDLKEKKRLPTNYGALVTREAPHDEAVIPGSPAEKAGIREGDILLECGNVKVTIEKPIQDFLEQCEVGDILKLTILRGEKKMSVSVKLAERK